MSNEIEYRVTGKYDAGPTFAKANEDTDKLGKKSKTTSENVKGLGDEVDNTSRKTKAFGGAVESNAETLRKLDGKITGLRESLKAMNLELARNPGDGDLLERIGKDRGELNKLRGIRKEITGLEDDAKRVAVETGTFASIIQGGIADSFKALPSEVKLGITASLVGVAAVAAPAIGATITAGILLGIGGGGLAAGIALAAKDPAVANAYGELGQRMVARLQQSAAPFRGELIQTAKTFRDTFDQEAPHLDSIFSKLATKVEPLASGLAKAFSNTMPGLEHSVEAALPLLQAVADNLPMMGKAMSTFFDSIAKGGPGAAAALKFLLVSIEAMIVATGWLFEGFSKVFEAVDKVGRKVFEVTNGGAPAMAMALDKTGASGDRLTQTIDGVVVTTDLAASTMDDFGNVGGKAFYGLDQRMRDSLETVQRINKAFEDLFNRAMDVDEAAIAYQRSIDELTDSFKENGRTLDANTEKGRRNREAVLAIVEAAERQREASIAAGNGTQESYDKANAAFLQQLQNLRAQLKALGASTTEVDKLIAKYEVLAKPVTKTITINIKENVSVSNEGVVAGGDLRRMIGGAYAHGGVPRAASGRITSGIAQSLTQVAERGREIALLAPGYAQLPPGSTILPNGATESIMGGGGGGGGRMAIEVIPRAVGDALMDAIVTSLRYRVRYDGGGSAEAYFASEAA